MDKELIMCIAMYVIIFLWIFICPVVVNGGEDKRKRNKTMSEHYCMYKDGMCELDIDEAYQQGRADTIDKVIKSLEAQFLMQNNPNSKFVETIVLHRDFIDALERLKGNDNER